MTTAVEPALVDTNVQVAFDTQLVATMLAGSIMEIHTFNTADFQAFAFAGIHATTP